MTTTTFADHLLTGAHSARPAVTTAPEGTLYSCTDHGLVYKNNGTTWDTWATLGASTLPTWDEYMTTLAPLHRWKFDEAAGTSSGDFLDTGSVGTLTLADGGSITYQQADPFGANSAAYFNTGNAQAGSIGSVPTGANDRTLVMLFKCAIGNTTKAVMQYGNAVTREYFMYQIWENDNSGTGGDLFDLWSDTFSTGRVGGDGRWHIVAIGLTGRWMRFWMDGQEAVRSANGTPNTSDTSTKLTVNGDGASIYVADLAVFNTWLGKAKLDKLWAILAEALD
jgi:hypothetical protein